MVKPNKQSKFNIESVVENIQQVVPVDFVDIEPSCCGLFIGPDSEFPVGHIEINQNHSPIVQFQSVVHEFAHFIDIVENGNSCGSLIDQEVIAFSVEQVIVNNVPVHVAINGSVKRVRNSYPVGFSPCCVEPEDVQQVVDRIREVVGQ